MRPRPRQILREEFIDPRLAPQTNLENGFPPVTRVGCKNRNSGPVDPLGLLTTFMGANEQYELTGDTS